MSPKIPLTLSFAKVANFLSVVGIIGSLIFYWPGTSTESKTRNDERVSNTPE